MKTICLLLFTIGVIGITPSSITQKGGYIPLLCINNDHLANAVKEVMIKEADYVDFQRHVLVLNTIEKNTGHQVRIGAVPKADIPDYLSSIKSSAKGIVQMDGFEIIVFGNSTKVFFLQQGNDFFNYMYMREPTPVEVDNIPPPPTIFEPIVWVYDLDDDKITLKYKGRVGIVEEIGE